MGVFWVCLFFICCSQVNELTSPLDVEDFVTKQSLIKCCLAPLSWSRGTFGLLNAFVFFLPTRLWSPAVASGPHTSWQSSSPPPSSCMGICQSKQHWSANKHGTRLLWPRANGAVEQSPLFLLYREKTHALSSLSLLLIYMSKFCYDTNGMCIFISCLSPFTPSLVSEEQVMNSSVDLFKYLLLTVSSMQWPQSVIS